MILFVRKFTSLLLLRILIQMETKKKHSEEVEELNKSIGIVFEAIPQFCQVNSSTCSTHD